MKKHENEFTLSIGGSMGPWIKVVLSGEKALKYIMQYSGQPPTEKIISPSSEEWARFWRSCKRIGIDKWKERYNPESIVSDGTWWVFNIHMPSLMYKGEGDNAYPIGFNAFLSAVSRLLGGLEFA
jgi:hypothetical protein